VLCGNIGGLCNDEIQITILPFIGESLLALSSWTNRVDEYFHKGAGRMCAKRTDICSHRVKLFVLEPQSLLRIRACFTVTTPGICRNCG
jgi:hypothetical protein